MAAVTTPLRRKLALAAGLLCLGTPLLSSCGFDYATDRPNVIAQGGYHIAGDGVRVVAARIVANEDGHGVFVATIALNPSADPVADAASGPTLTGISAAQDSKVQVQAKSFSPIAVGDSGAVNLADPAVGGVTLTGNFTAGDIVPVELAFSDGEKIKIQTPVVTQCNEYASVAPQAGGGHASKSASSQASAGATDQAQPSGSAPAAPYDCSYPEPSASAAE
jgi:hypothetical protein